MSDKPDMRSYVDTRWRLRGACLLVGALLAYIALGHYHARRIEGRNLAIANPDLLAQAAEYHGRRINAWEPDEYADVYQLETDAPAAREGLWLGNSQLHTVNQAQPDDSPAPRWASEALGFPVFALSLNNANFQEHLLVTHWALARRDIDYLIVPLVFDDLREDGLRRELEPLADDATMQRFAAHPVGETLAPKLLARIAGGDATDVQGTTQQSDSLQDRSEAFLTEKLSALSPLYADREDIVAGVSYDLYRLRNYVFGIDPSTKRRVIPLRKQRNMEALAELFAVAEAAQVRTIAYIVPLRWDVEPPYVLSEYEAWKAEAAQLAAEHGVTLLDLDQLVPDDLWGLHHGAALDFMHFQGQGHRILGRRIADAIRDLEAPPGE